MKGLTVNITIRHGNFQNSSKRFLFRQEGLTFEMQ